MKGLCTYLASDFEEEEKISFPVPSVRLWSFLLVGLLFARLKFSSFEYYTPTQCFSFMLN
jgi:hypothetical protein